MSDKAFIPPAIEGKADPFPSAPSEQVGPIRRAIDAASIFIRRKKTARNISRGDIARKLHDGKTLNDDDNLVLAGLMEDGLSESDLQRDDDALNTVAEIQKKIDELPKLRTQLDKTNAELSDVEKKLAPLLARREQLNQAISEQGMVVFHTSNQIQWLADFKTRHEHLFGEVG